MPPSPANSRLDNIRDLQAALAVVNRWMVRYDVHQELAQRTGHDLPRGQLIC